MPKSTLELFREHKLEKKFQKELAKRVESKQKYYDNLAKKKMDKIKEQNEITKRLKISKLEKEVKRKYKNLVREKTGEMAIEKVLTVAKLKQLAYTTFCKYAVLIRVLPNGTIYVLDKKEYMDYKTTKGISGGHLYPKHNYPQIAFEIDNVRPITKNANRRQLDTIGYDWINEVTRSIGADRMVALESIALDEGLKSRCSIGRTRWYYQQIVDKYSKVNKELLNKINLG